MNNNNLQIFLATIALLNAVAPALVLKRIPFLYKRFDGFGIGGTWDIVPFVQIAFVAGGEWLLRDHATMACALAINGLALLVSQSAQPVADYVALKIRLGS